MAEVAPSLGISIVEKIRADILSAKFPPGAKLTVKLLSDLYRCGASPIREALNQVVTEGLVTRIDRRGFFVSTTSAAEFHDIVYNRQLLEGEALRRSIERGGEDWEERVVVAHFRLDILRREIEVDGETTVNVAWEAAHKRFHMALLSACGSKILLENCERLFELNHRYRMISGQMSQQKRDIAGEHTRIRALTLDRRADEAVAALRAHYLATGEYIFGAG